MGPLAPPPPPLLSPPSSSRRLPVSFAALLGAALAATGCGSASVSELPPPEGPPRAIASLDRGRLEAVLDGRARTLTLRDPRTGARLGTTGAGVGPTSVACNGAARCYVADTRGDALLVFLAGEGGRTLRLTRRVYLPGGPRGMALDPARRTLWVTLPRRGELARLPAHGRPHVLARYPTTARPRAVRVDAASGAALVTGPPGTPVQRVLP